MRDFARLLRRSRRGQALLDVLGMDIVPLEPLLAPHPVYLRVVPAAAETSAAAESAIRIQ